MCLRSSLHFYYCLLILTINTSLARNIAVARPPLMAYYHWDCIMPFLFWEQSFSLALQWLTEILTDMHDLFTELVCNEANQSLFGFVCDT